MKDLETVLKAYEHCFIDIYNHRKCRGCIYHGEGCSSSMLNDFYKYSKELKEEYERLRYTKNIYEETMVLFSNANKELLEDMKSLKEENNKLKEEGKKLIIEMYRMDQYK